MACLTSVIFVICELYGMHAILVEDAVTYHVHYTWSIFLKKFVALPFMILAEVHLTIILLDKSHLFCSIEEDPDYSVSEKNCTSTADDLVVNETRRIKVQWENITIVFPPALFIVSDIASECLNLYLFRRSEHITIGGHA